METKEIWKDVVGYEGLYQVSNLGNIRSLNYSRTKKVKILKQSTNRYKYVSLSKLNNTKTKTIHSLVAEAFIGERNGLMIDHIDMDKLNNSASNLRYVTNRENQHNTLKNKINSTSKYKGVTYDKIRNKYKASITCKITFKNLTLGRFKTEDEAALRINEYVIENDYKHYRLNFLN